jgi:glycosyltransferase involved in cell wall biosynthesis
VPTVSVIIPARDSERTVLRTLAGVAEQDAPGDHEIILVDNGSRDDTAGVAERAGIVDRLIRRARGDGPGAARTAGAAAARGEVLAFIDADCWPDAAWLAAGVRALASAELVQGRVVPDPGVPVGPFDRTLAVNSAHGLFESANLFVRRELFERIGGFPEGLEPPATGGGRRGAPFGEDVIFGWTARRLGARTSFCAQALTYHEVRPRGAADFIRERARLALFPTLARQVPELRDVFFYRRAFLNRRSASFDLAAAGLSLCLLRRRPAGLAATVPYIWQVARDGRQWGWHVGPQVALAGVAADAVGAVALLVGSVRSGSVLL